MVEGNDILDGTDTFASVVDETIILIPFALVQLRTLNLKQNQIECQSRSSLPMIEESMLIPDAKSSQFTDGGIRSIFRGLHRFSSLFLA